MTESIFGPVVSTIAVEKAVISTLQVWIPEWLTALEEKEGLFKGELIRPPDPESYHGGDDFESYKSDLLPEYIVDVKAETLERFASAGYEVGYEIQIAVIVQTQDEESARLQASLHGAAMMLLVQQPELGGLAERLVMTKPPTPEFLDPSVRNFMRAVGSFMAWVVPVVDDRVGPPAPQPGESEQYNGPEEPWDEEPTIESVDVTFKAEKI